MPLSSEFFDLAELTPTYLKNKYLPGLVFLDAEENEFSDSFYQDYLDQAATLLEELCDITIREKTITAESHDFHINDYVQYCFLNTLLVPVRSVSEVRAVFPTGITVQTFDASWVRLDQKSGQIHIVPTAGSLGQVLLGQGSAYLPLIYGNYSYVPALWEVDYTAGFDSTLVPRTIVDAICKLAVRELLLFLSPSSGGPIGVTSHSSSIDGMSQSRSYQKPAFADIMDRINAELDGSSGSPDGGLISRIRMLYRGILLTSM